MKTGVIAALAGLALLAGTPAGAQQAVSPVKTGVDAWSRGDYKNAVEAWRGPAIAGDADAQFNLGQAYKLGRGVPVDLAQAEAWYARAAAQGHIQAADNYGLALFQNGKRAEAVPWIEKSVARGEPRAQYIFGTMLFNGDGVAKDWVRAYALMVRASAAGLPQASQALGEMDQYISLTDRQQGIQLARTYEAEAARPQLPPEIAGNPGGMQGVDLPPSNANGPDMHPAPPPPARTTRPARPPVETARTNPPPTEQPTRVASGGRWRIQLGAFRDDGNARTLWENLKGHVSAVAGLQPFLVRSGTLTRLQAGPLASGADAARACAAVRPTGTPCVPVAP